MLDLLKARLRQGTRTIPVPVEHADFPERFRGRPELTPAPEEEQTGPPPTIDAGTCLFSPEEAGPVEGGTVAFTRDWRMASSTRDGLVSPTGEIELARALDARARRLFGRSLRLRSVAAGSCGGCEAELSALGNVVFDLARFGVQFVASPRHADGIVVTGAVNRNMRPELERTWAAVPDPRLVIAVGACAISGGPFRGSATVTGGVPAELPVDLWIPGCPPHPLTILDGLLRLLGRIEDGTRTTPP